MSVASDSSDLLRARRRHLTALAYAVEVQGFTWRLLGRDESVLRVLHPGSGRSAMAVAMPSPVAGWFYLWTGDGMADATDPSVAAGRIAELLTSGTTLERPGLPKPPV